MKGCLLVILSGLVYLSTAYASVPVITDDFVRFDSGFLLKYSQKEELFSNPRVALEKNLPVFITEKPVLIEEWERMFLIRKNLYYEGSTTELSVYDFSGHLLSPSLKFTGEARFLTKKNRILLAQISAHRMVGRSFLLDKDGKLLATIKHGEISDFGVSDDEKLIWFYSNRATNGKPYTRILFANIDGDIVAQKDIDESGEVTIDFEGRSYSVKVDRPELPG
jgi:hypothetical protein